MSVADRPAFPNGLTPKPIALVSSGTFLGICFRFPLRFGNREAQVLQEPKAPLHTPPVLCFARNRQKCGWYRAKRRGNLTITQGNAVLLHRWWEWIFSLPSTRYSKTGKFRPKSRSRSSRNPHGGVTRFPADQLELRLPACLGRAG